MEKHEVSDPKATYIWSVWIFAVLFSVVFACFFLDSAPLFGFLSKLNLKFICWTELYVERVSDKKT